MDIKDYILTAQEAKNLVESSREVKFSDKLKGIFGKIEKNSAEGLRFARIHVSLTLFSLNHLSRFESILLNHGYEVETTKTSTYGAYITVKW